MEKTNTPHFVEFESELSEPLFSELDDSFARTWPRLSSTSPRASCPQGYIRIHPKYWIYEIVKKTNKYFVKKNFGFEKIIQNSI